MGDPETPLTPSFRKEAYLSQLRIDLGFRVSGLGFIGFSRVLAQVL